MESYISRVLLSKLKEKVRPQKVLILLGARRVGKTELIKKFVSLPGNENHLLLNGEDQSVIDAFSQRTVSNYKRIIGNSPLLIIDEAQHIPDIGPKLKLIVDEIPTVAVIVTGSSVFDLQNRLGEPLVGREVTMQLFPLSQMEFSNSENLIETRNKLEERLIFGAYPELEHISSWEKKSDYLEGLVGSYLLRDILAYNGIRKSDKIMDLLRLVAFQVGKEISLDELANSLKGISRNTIESYLDLLTKVFVLYNVRGFSRNLRKEVTKTSRWYFYDNGIRNAIIRNFNPLQMRMDKGELWENYLMAERLKHNSYTGRRANQYFWRTYDQQELDLVEEVNGTLSGYEFKWNPKKSHRAPGGWKKAYPEASFEVITTDNYLDFVSP